MRVKELYDRLGHDLDNHEINDDMEIFLLIPGNIVSNLSLVEIIDKTDKQGDTPKKVLVFYPHPRDMIRGVNPNNSGGTGKFGEMMDSLLDGFKAFAESNEPDKDEEK